MNFVTSIYSSFIKVVFATDLCKESLINDEIGRMHIYIYIKGYVLSLIIGEGGQSNNSLSLK